MNASAWCVQILWDDRIERRRWAPETMEMCSKIVRKLYVVDREPFGGLWS